MSELWRWQCRRCRGEFETGDISGGTICPYCSMGACRRTFPFWHDDKPEERADKHITTAAGDLDLAGRPLKSGS